MSLMPLTDWTVINILELFRQLQNAEKRSMQPVILVWRLSQVWTDVEHQDPLWRLWISLDLALIWVSDDPIRSAKSIHECTHVCLCVCSWAYVHMCVCMCVTTASSGLTLIFSFCSWPLWLCCICLWVEIGGYASLLGSWNRRKGKHFKINSS